jgi:hypothetical protein
MRLNEKAIRRVRTFWQGRATFLGFPDAERDARAHDWVENLLVRPNWFESATGRDATIVVGRKGVGKSASRIAAEKESESGARTGRPPLVLEASADELATRHADRLQKASDRGFGAVSDWCHVFAELVVRRVASDLKGTLITDDDYAEIRQWSTLEGISERDFGERLASTLKGVVNWARKFGTDKKTPSAVSDERFQRVANAKSYALYIDDFDNIQEIPSLSNTRLIRDAVEAADRVTHHNTTASVHLLMRQDLWLRLRPGWHYADKVAGLVSLNWSQDDLRKWADRRLRNAVALALDCRPNQLEARFGEYWNIFFPETITLRNDDESAGIHYLVKRTMYTPRGLRQFMELILRKAKSLPADQRAIEDAEEEFSVDQLEFLKTEFGALCHGLDICLQSFTGKTGETIPSVLYKHLNGLLGNGQVRLVTGAADGEDAQSLARFLFRIGFLEVRYPQNDRFEVRDAMRHPDHWKSIRTDDALRWAVRSAFFCALRSHRG